MIILKKISKVPDESIIIQIYNISDTIYWLGEDGKRYRLYMVIDVLI